MNLKTAVSQLAPSVQLEHSLDDLSFSDSWEQEVEPEHLSVQVATSMREIKGLRRVWRKWTHGLETDLDYFSHNLKNDSTVLRPHVITVWEDGVAQAMLVGYVRKRRVSTVVSFVNIPGPNVNVLEIVKGGRIGRQSSAIDKLLAMELLRAIRSGDVDLVCFQRLSLHSELLREVQRLPGLLVKDRVPHVFYYSVLSLKARGGERASLLPGKARREVRRKTRILEREFPDKARVKCFSEPSEMDTGIRDALMIAEDTWQYHLGDGLSDTSQTQANLRFFAKKRWLRIYVLYLEDRPCAFLIGQVFKTTFYCQYAGYHPDFARFSVGSLLTAWALESLAEAGVRQVDLGEGGQEHNRRLGCQKHEEGTVHVYSPTLRGLWLNMFFAATQTIRAGGRRTRSRLGLNRAVSLLQQFLISRAKARRSSSELPVRYCQLINLRPVQTNSHDTPNCLQNLQNMPSNNRDPYAVPAFPLRNRLKRAVWGLVCAVFFRTSPRPFHRWRAFLLRCFGAKLGRSVSIYPKASIWAPWNLVCADLATIADEAIIYNPSIVSLGSHAIISQQAYVCGATHAYEDPNFPLVSFPISIGEYAWVCARATVQAGVQVGDGAILALGSVASKDLEPWTIYGGIPARPIKTRKNITQASCEEVFDQRPSEHVA
jgi:putative colanic acid biosynthesis acetyltransferase WcaF